MRTAGIIGLDFSGSTVITNILSGLPKTISVGESHWILNKRQLGCIECFNEPCPIFTKELLERLRITSLAPGEWWSLIGEQAGAELVISSDKRPRHYERFGIPGKIIFLIKDPRANISSHCRRRFKDEISEDGKFTSEQIDLALVWWYSNSKGNIDWIQEKGVDCKVISLELFMDSPESSLKSLCDWLGITFDEKALKFWETDLHYVGGNHSVKRLTPDRHFFEEIKPDYRWKNELHPEDAQRIIDDNRVQMILDRTLPQALNFDKWPFY